MRKTLILAAASSVLLTGAALASTPNVQQDPNQVNPGIYAGVDGGVAIPAGHNFGNILSTGFDVGAHVGYRFNQNFRAELAYTYINNSAKQKDIFTNKYPHFHSNLFMANGYYDLPVGANITPFIGAGLGVVHFSASDGDLSVDGNTEFAYQGIAGVAYNFTPNLAANVSYHLISWTDEPGLQNLINAGINYYFS